MEKDQIGLWDEPISANTEAVETTEVVETTEAAETTDITTSEQQTENINPIVSESTDIINKEDTVEKEEVEKIKEVEKIIEKYPEMDDYSKTIFEAIQNNNEDEIYAYLKEKRRNYDLMSDIDVIKIKMKKDNPNWTDKYIDAQIKHKYGKSFEKIDLDTIDQEIDYESYKLALSHNEEIERNEILLEQDAMDSRLWLNEQKKNVQFPKVVSEKEQTEPIKQFTEEEIAELNKQWESNVEVEVPKISDLVWKIGDEEVIYKATDDERKDFVQLMKNFNDVDYLTKRGWYDEKGNINILAVAEDVRKLESIDKIISSIATQVQVLTKKSVISKDIKNIDKSEVSVTNDTNIDLATILWQ